MRAHTFDGRLGPRSQRRQTGASQADNRRGFITYDQHGRPFDGVIELRSNAPTGPLHPKFRAPFYPDPKFLKVNPDNNGEAYIDYPAWFRDRRQSEAEYHQRAVRLSNKKGWPEPKPGQYSEQVEEELGPLPSHTASVLVAAAYQENPWLIGACQGCSSRDGRTSEFLPRFSHNCVCPDGFKAYAPDPRLAKYLARPEDALVDSPTEDFSIDSYAEITGQTIDEVRQRPTQFRRIVQRAPSDGALPLVDDEQAAQTGALERMHDAPLSEADAENLDAAIAELESVGSDADVFAGKGGRIDADIEEEAADPEALGGRRVAVTAQARVPAQAPRAGNGTSRRQIGAERSAKAAKQATTRRSPRRAPGDTRPSLADGAAPVIADH